MQGLFLKLFHSVSQTKVETPYYSRKKYSMIMTGKDCISLDPVEGHIIRSKRF